MSLNIHAFHNNPEVWGADHTTYDPDRFYDARAKELKEFVIPFMVRLSASLDLDRILRVFALYRLHGPHPEALFTTFIKGKRQQPSGLASLAIGKTLTNCTLGW